VRSKNKKFILLAMLFLAWLFIFSNGARASSNNLIISEIMYDPSGADTGHSDWIELYNPTEKNITIKKDDFGLIDEDDLVLGKDGIHYLNCHKIKQDLALASGEFLILADDEADFSVDYPIASANVIDSTFSLSTNGDSIHLSSDKCATFFEEVKYVDSWGAKNNGNTLEKRNLSNDNSEDNWQESYVEGGTPGAENSQKPKPKEYSKNIFINEILPNPVNEDDEYIELYNSEDTDVDLVNWILRDGSKTGKYVISKGSIIKAGEYFAIYKKDYKFALNNSGDESVFLYDPNGKLVSEISYKSAKENISYNFDGSYWRWSRYLTPGTENKFNNLPDSKEKKDKNIYVGMYADFSLEASDKDGDKLKFTWDFGDGHRSYLKKTRHKYEKAGKYRITLKISDGSEDKIEIFDIEVKKYPESKLKIISVIANPSGIDSKNEYIVVENRTKKKINLKGWSVATGSKKLYNHPITKKIVINPGKSLKITRKISKFTLNNKKCKIELRYPNGKVADKVKYNLGQKSVKDDEIYEETENGWQWLDLQSDADLGTTLINADESMSQNNAEITAPIDNEDGEMQINTSENFEDFIGGQSLDNSEKLNKEQLLNYGTTIKLANYNMNNNGRVLGVETVKTENGIYTFTSSVVSRHKALKFLINLGIKINFFINKLILRLS
jgi:hypothetical protein